MTIAWTRTVCLASFSLVLLAACSSSSSEPTTGADAATPDAGVDAPADSPSESSAPTTACAGQSFSASCQSKDNSICFDMYGALEATTKGACPAAVGTWQATPCTTTGHVGGCERTGTPAPGACMVQWYFSPFTVAKIKQDCAAPATYHAP